MGDNYIKTPPHKSIIKLALMPLRGEGRVRGDISVRDKFSDLKM
jgi:hypothetical protein